MHKKRPQEGVEGPDRDTCPSWAAFARPRFGVSSDYKRLRKAIVLYVGEKMKDWREMMIISGVLKVVRDAL